MKIDIKNSNVSGSIPTTSSLKPTEFAINNFDGKVYYLKDNGIKSISELVSTKHTGSFNLKGDMIIESGSGDFYIHGNKQYNYGIFESTSSFSGSANVSYSVNLNTTDIAHEISIVSGSRITFNSTGVYYIQYQAQIQQGSGDCTIVFWTRNNGINHSNSATKITLKSNNYHLIPGGHLEEISSGSYVEIMWQSDSNNTVFPYSSATDLVYSKDGSKTYIGWLGLTPNCILYQIKTQQGPYTYDELQAILATPEWS